MLFTIFSHPEIIITDFYENAIFILLAYGKEKLWKSEK
jgi:hypothetical protein